MRLRRSLDSAIVIPALVVFVLLICQACAQATAVSQTAPPPQGTPVASAEVQAAQPTPGLAAPPTPVSQTAAPPQGTPVASAEAQAAQPERGAAPPEDTPDTSAEAQAAQAEGGAAPPRETPVASEGIRTAPPAPRFAVPHPTDFEETLSGDTLAMYQGLPPEFQQALQAYAAWGIAHDLVPVAIEQKMRQWPANPVPMSDILSSVGYQKFRELEPRLYEQALFLLYVYPYALSTEEDPAAQQRVLERMVAAMHQGEPDDPFEPPLPRDPDAYKYPIRDPNEPLNLQDGLTGDTLTRYKNLPPEYRQALWNYAQTIPRSEQIPVAIERAVLNLPENPEPLLDILSPDTYEKFQDLDSSIQVAYLLDWYPKVLKEPEDPDLRKRDLEQLAIAMYEQELDDHVRLPSVEKVLLPETIRKLDSLGPNLQRSFRDLWGEASWAWDYGMGLPAWMKDWELFLLKAPSGLELPPLEAMLSEESLQQFRRLPLDDQRSVRNQYASSALWCAGMEAARGPNDTLPLDILDVSRWWCAPEAIEEHIAFLSRIAPAESSGQETTR